MYFGTYVKEVAEKEVQEVRFEEGWVRKGAAGKTTCS